MIAVSLTTNSLWFVHENVIQRHLGFEPILEITRERTINFHESLDEHSNELVRKAIQYHWGTYTRENVQGTTY